MELGSLAMKLDRLGFKSLQQYNSSSHWKKVRTAYAKSDCPKECLCCGSAKYQLHHRTYDRVGAESLDDLVPLCGRCHRDVHAAHRQYGIALRCTEEAIAVVNGDDSRPFKRARPVPIGLIVKAQLAKGVPYRQAVEEAYRRAGKPPPRF